MDDLHDAETYSYASEADPSCTGDYLLPAVTRALAGVPRGARVFEIGCGNGVTAKALARLGYDVTAVDTSVSGIEMARLEGASQCRFEVGSAYDDLAGRFGTFDAVVSLEVVEHLFSPATFARTVKALLAEGAPAVISTPYHGYLKNLALAVMDKWDRHHAPNWEGGHIKFWSRASLREFFESAGLRETAFLRVGRIAPLAKSMIGVYRSSGSAS